MEKVMIYEIVKKMKESHEVNEIIEWRKVTIILNEFNKYCHLKVATINLPIYVRLYIA